MRGVFSDGQDRLGAQARTLLKKDLVQERPILGRRPGHDGRKPNQEAQIAGVARNLKAAKVVVAGEVTAFGRKQTGDKQLFGIARAAAKSQTAYSKVTLNVIDGPDSSAIIYSVEGAGEYDLSNREVLGFGSTAAYDSTLNGKGLEPRDHRGRKPTGRGDGSKGKWTAFDSSSKAEAYRSGWL